MTRYKEPVKISLYLFKNIAVLTFCATLFSSCDPGIAVAISNTTKKDKHIRVIYPQNYTFPGESRHNTGILGALPAYRLDMPAESRHQFREVINYSGWDTAAQTYTFTLKANYRAVVESRIITPFPTFGQVFVIDNTDTVRLEMHGKDFKKKPALFLGGTWTHTIKEKKE
jgi:hypothetical protein